MGLLPQLRPSASKAVSHHNSHLHEQPVKCIVNTNQVLTESPISTDAQQLKASILSAHADSPQFVRFSFRRMRHRTTPPVEIPENVAHARARTACVAGKKVPFTRAMHANAQKKVSKRQLDSIDEHVRY